MIESVELRIFAIVSVAAEGCPKSFKQKEEA